MDTRAAIDRFLASPSLSASTRRAYRADLRDFMREVRGRSLALMVERLDEGVRNGDLPKGTDVAQIADFFETVFRGMAVRARDGADREMLEKTGVMALDAWPGGRA